MRCSRRSWTGAVAPEVVWCALRAATVSGRVVPMLAGSAYRHRGVEPLLDAMVALLPSPWDARAGAELDELQAAEAGRGVISRRVHAELGESPGAEAGRGVELVVLGFKVTFDDHGQLTFVRVYRGVLEKG